MMLVRVLLSAGSSTMRYLATLITSLLLASGATSARAEAFDELGGYQVEGVIVPGTHTRLDTVNGAVHVWIPEGYDAATASLVVYIHGYYVDVDDAWWAHGLPEQFGATGINAMFLAPESPSSGWDDVRWESITDLALTIEGLIDEPMPKGRKVVVAHSGGFRTVQRWLGADLDTVVLLDAGYGPHETYGPWMRKYPKRRIITIASSTLGWNRWLRRYIPSMSVIANSPRAAVSGLAKLNPRLIGMLSHERAVLVESWLDHWQVVTTALPTALELLGAKQVPAPMAAQL